MAVELLGVIEKVNCKPGTHEYSMVIDSLCKDRMVDSAMKLFNDMPKKASTATLSPTVSQLMAYLLQVDGKKLKHCGRR
ncbi:hypothetical protein BUALT_Bualt12G0032300 [Buddleja alternifolia]|uniref:Pentatricopeptide repeat-containing protein n=1 Tax=Buddleja alternifolia TaxID=168488 RepID=A0AAV6WWC6_9LAMI|nr:hypothetical protein BUALT_Bualt12G0032300 [Buddleja alternifolia]